MAQAKTPAPDKQAFVQLKSSRGDWLVPPELRPRLVEDAVAAGTNLTDYVLGLLAERYKVALPERKGRRTAPSPNDEVINMAVPRKLAVVINDRATRAGHSWINEIRSALCQHYGMRLPIPPRHTRKRRAA